MQRILLAMLATILLAGAQNARAQRLEAVGVGASFNVSQTWARQRIIQVEQYTIRTDDDGSRADDTGNRFSAYARIGFGAGKWFVQPEVAYTSVLGNQSSISYYSRPNAPWPDISYVYPRLKRTEVALLGGVHLGRRWYAVAGPLVAFNQRPGFTPANNLAGLYASLEQSPERVQALAQAGVGVQLWRFDLTARYEHSLTPYTRQFKYNQQTYAYRQRTSQFILGAGFLLHDRHRPWRR